MLSRVTSTLLRLVVSFMLPVHMPYTVSFWLLLSRKGLGRDVDAREI